MKEEEGMEEGEQDNGDSSGCGNINFGRPKKKKKKKKPAHSILSIE